MKQRYTIYALFLLSLFVSISASAQIKARDRRVVIEIQGVIALAMATIHPDLIEVIK